MIVMPTARGVGLEVNGVISAFHFSRIRASEEMKFSNTCKTNRGRFYAVATQSLWPLDSMSHSIAYLKLTKIYIDH